MKALKVLSLGVVVTLLLVSCAPAATPCPTCPPTPECPPTGPVKDLGGREVRIAVENAYPPFNVIDEATGEGVGWDYDVWRAVCEKLNCTPVFVEAAWEGLFEAMAAGEYDVAADGITITLARSLKVDFSDPYVEYGQVIMVRADETEITDAEGLVASDKTVGTQIGTTNEIAAIRLFGEERVVSFDTYDLPVVALTAGEVDCVIIDEVAAVGFMRENPGQLKVAFPVKPGELLAFVFPPLSDLVEPVNWAMQDMFADGTMDEICEEWFARPCSE